MQNENTLTTPLKLDPITQVKQELKKLIKDFPNRYGYAKKVADRLKEKGYDVDQSNVFNVVNTKTYYDRLIVLEIKVLHQEYLNEINLTLSELQTDSDNAGGTNHSQN